MVGCDRRHEYRQDRSRIQGLRRDHHAARRRRHVAGGRDRRSGRHGGCLAARYPRVLLWAIEGQGRPHRAERDRSKDRLAVPKYSQLSSIEDLKTKAAVVEGKVIGIDPGAGLMKASDKVIKEYGLPVK